MSEFDSVPTRVALLTLDEVAEVCRTSKSTVRWWVHCGRLRSVKVGRRRLVTQPDFAAFLNTCGIDLSSGVG